jgi:hypothetical protein
MSMDDLFMRSRHVPRMFSKLARLADKDKEFIEAYHAVRPLDPKLIRDRIKATDLEVEISERALAFIARLTKAAN